MSNQQRQIRVVIDLGGTFTDFVLARRGAFHTNKVLTTHEAPERAVMRGLSRLMSISDTSPEDIGLIVHGTTLATNAIIERKGARVAMLTTQGHRDVLELADESRFDQYDLRLVKPQPLIPRDLRFGIPERLAADGSVLVPLDLATIKTIAEVLIDKQIESVAICFLHSFINPEHERSVARVLRRQIPGIHLSLSSQVSPVIREYERFSTTVANAYVQPKIDRYLEHLEGQLGEAGFTCPLYLFLSNGSLAEVAIAREFPIRLVESGPAGGAVFSSHIAQTNKEDRILSFDMGGTTAKICLIDDAEPQKSDTFEMAREHRFRRGSGLPVRVPVIDMVEIGAGGGSIARVDQLARIAVGPDSAGSEPGPACFDLGGSDATVTDANLLLGRLEPEGFANGEILLNAALAESAIRNNLAEPLGMQVPQAAAGVAAIIEEDMANAAREHATESGKSLIGRTLVAFGGAAPAHAISVADKLGVGRVIIPSDAGVGSAIGFLMAPVAYELSRSCSVRLSQFSPEVLNELYRTMSDEAHRVVASAAPLQERNETRLARMRYVGQGYDIAVPMPVRKLRHGSPRRTILHSARWEQRIGFSSGQKR